MVTETSNLNRDGYTTREEVLADLADSGPVQVQPDERLWKLFIFRPASGRANRLEHRIYSKLKPDGRLALVTFAVHTPPGKPSARSGIARVPELTDETLQRIIDSIRRETHIAPEEYEEIDLSHLGSLKEQVEYLRRTI
jgi:hypothetical protein